MSYWNGVSNNFRIDADPCEGDITETICIDAWKTEDDNEGGAVIAKVIKTKSGDVGVVYINNIARTDSLAQEAIREAVQDLGGILEPAPETAEKYCLMTYCSGVIGGNPFNKPQFFNSFDEARERMQRDYDGMFLDFATDENGEPLKAGNHWRTTICDSDAKIVADEWFAEWQIVKVVV